MKKEYAICEMEIIRFDVEDVITTSPEDEPSTEDLEIGGE